MTTSELPPFGPDDDRLHDLTNDEWETETTWFSFNVPERKMGGWFHGPIRPNQNNCSSRVFIWDPSAADHANLAYYHESGNQPLPEKRDLTDFAYPKGYSVKVLKPTMDYLVSYADPDGSLKIEIEHRGIHPPHRFKPGLPPFHRSVHFDQAGHVVGEMTLKGERIAIDCFSLRDRSWGPRPAPGAGKRRGTESHSPKDETPDPITGDWRAIDRERGRGRIQYIFGTADEKSGFLAFLRPQEGDETGWSPMNHGYLLRDGECIQLATGKLLDFRDPDTGFGDHYRFEATDEKGRELVADGYAVSRISDASSGGSGAHSLVRWAFDGKVGWGEDQDIWRPAHWADMMRQLQATL